MTSEIPVLFCMYDTSLAVYVPLCMHDTSLYVSNDSISFIYNYIHFSAVCPCKGDTH